MRSLRILASTVWFLAVAAPLFAQEDSVDLVSKENFFSVTFPGTPKVTEGSWQTEFGVVLPSTVYTVEASHARYSLAVVDYTPVERVLTQKSRERCPIASDTCNGLRESGLGYWKDEYRGGTTYAVSTVLAGRDVRVTHLAFHFIMMTAGLELWMTDLKDQSQTVAVAYMNRNRLYLLQTTAPQGWPVPRTMQYSLSWVNAGGGGRGYLYRNDPDRDEPGFAFQPVR